ncbi:flagellar type III secretion system pore protein FliP [Frateuria aurantia]
MKRRILLLCALGLLMLANVAMAQNLPMLPSAAGLPALTVQTGAHGEQHWTLSMQLLALMTALTMLPAAVLMMTSFTRIIIVLSLLRQALGTSSTPSNQILLGLALFLTLFVMSPVLDSSYNQGFKPYMAGTLSAEQAMPLALAPFKHFMVEQTRDPDLQLFSKLAHEGPYRANADIPLRVLAPSFVTSELKTAFEMSFLIYIPFLIVDLIVASVLMSMGMMMLSPTLISLPFKILLFVLVDGWSLLLGTLAGSFYT